MQWPFYRNCRLGICRRVNVLVIIVCPFFKVIGDGCLQLATAKASICIVMFVDFPQYYNYIYNRISIIIILIIF